MKFFALFLMSALVTVSSLAHAQDASTTPPKNTWAHDPQMWAGIGLGPNFSSYTNDSPLSGSTEFQVKGFIDWHLQDIWFLSTAVRYNTYGVHGTEDGMSVGFHGNYLEIPVLIKPTIDAGGWYPYVMVGPNFGFKTGEGVSVSGTDIGTSAMKTFDFSMDFGIGAEVPILPNIRAFAEFEYALGLIQFQIRQMAAPLKLAAPCSHLVSWPVSDLSR